jgi:hypothetical protein
MAAEADPQRAVGMQSRLSGLSKREALKNI